MSISKRIAAIVSTAVVVAGAFAAAPASAQTVSQNVNSTISVQVDRKIDANNHQVKFFAGEQISLDFNGTIQRDTALAHMVAGDKIVFNPTISVVNGTLSANGWANSTINVSGAPVANGNNSGALEYTAASLPTSSISFNFNYSQTATTDVTLTFNPTVTLGTYTAVTNDFSWSNANAGINGGFPGQITTGSRVANAEDEMINLYADSVCVDTSSLVSGDTLELQATATGGSVDATWQQVSTNGGMGGGMGGFAQGLTYNFTSVPSDKKLSVGAMMHVGTPAAGTTYSLSGIKVVKQGSTTDLITGCGDTLATAVTAIVDGVVTTTIDKTPDAASNYMMYVCALYAVADTAFATPVKATMGSMFGPTGPLPSPVCRFSSVPAGTYKVGVRGVGSMAGIVNEKIQDGTVTVGGSVTPAKKAPKVPTVATKVKIGKTFSVALHATKGTASKGANADGLATTVTVASASKAFCSVTAVKKSGKITGYTVKGLKAGKCSVVLTITGDATYNSLTKTVAATVSK